jgi:hypothetical protein
MHSISSSRACLWWSKEDSFSTPSLQLSFNHPNVNLYTHHARLAQIKVIRPGAMEISAPNRCRFFIWLSLLGRCWTSERLFRHGLRSDGVCALCCQSCEWIDHMLCKCVFSHEVWFKALRRAGWQHPTQHENQRIPSVKVTYVGADVNTLLHFRWWQVSRRKYHQFHWPWSGAHKVDGSYHDLSCTDKHIT